MVKKQERKPTGLEPERVKLEGDWAENVRKEMEKKKPPQGWPIKKPKAR